jgi:hypothetical protein
MLAFCLGEADHERVAVRIESIHPHNPDHWVSVHVSVRAGGFSGEFSADFTASEILAFRDEMRALYESLHGTAKFNTLEGQLDLTLTGNGRGGIAVAGTCMDRAGIGNRLGFSLALDQTYLAQTLRQLDEVCRACSPSAA